MTASRTLALATSAVLSGSIATAHAAANDASGRAIEEVIVSVERVEQTLQSYEGAAVAMSQAALDMLGADQPALMPGLEIPTTRATPSSTCAASAAMPIPKTYAARMVIGLQGAPATPKFLDSNHVIATAKHFIGDGGTDQGIDRGGNLSPEQQLLDIHGQGYTSALHAGVQTIMASYNSWRGWKVHGQSYLLTNVLKQQMGFDGPVSSDWDGVGKLSFSWPRHSTQLALNRHDRYYDALFAYGFGVTYRDRDRLGPL